MSGNLKFFNEINSKVQFGFSMLRICVTKGPLVDRIKISTVYILLIVIFFLLSFHISATFDGNITNNILMAFLILSGVTQVLLKNFSGLAIDEEVLKQLNQWIRSLYEEIVDDLEIQHIISNNLRRITDFWKIAFKLGYLTVFVVSTAFPISSMLKGEEGIIFAYPYMPTDFPYSLQLRHLIQWLILYSPSYNLINCDLSIFYVGLQFFGAININDEIIKYWNEDIQAKSALIKTIAKRHCDIIKNIDYFQDVLLWISFTHFVTSTFILLFLFTLIRTNVAVEIAVLVLIFIQAELFLLCLFGEIIQVKMEQLLKTFYLTNWYDLSVKDQKAFLIILGMMQRTYTLRAARLYDINFNSFIQIVKMAISYCAILLTFGT
uniref:Odorant receptor n=1 Tax=Lutzomyia longipalpis TaxID=7200 RepID=A0A3F2ZDE6_LUTLO